MNPNLLKQLANTSLSTTERARLTREVIETSPSYRPLPIDLKVVKAILNQYGYEWAFGAANRMADSTKKAALLFVIEARPPNHIGNEALTQVLIELKRYDAALQSMVDEYRTYAKMPFPIDIALITAWGTHLVQSCQAMGWDTFERFFKETLTIKTPLAFLLKTAFQKAIVQGRQKAFRDKALRQWDAVYLKCRAQIAKDKGLV